jgi:hypothetical protein
MCRCPCTSKSNPTTIIWLAASNWKPLVLYWCKGLSLVYSCIRTSKAGAGQWMRMTLLNRNHRALTQLSRTTHIPTSNANIVMARMTWLSSGRSSCRSELNSIETPAWKEAPAETGVFGPLAQSPVELLLRCEGAVALEARGVSTPRTHCPAAGIESDWGISWFQYPR